MINTDFPRFMNELFSQPITPFHNPIENARQGQFESYIVMNFRTWYINQHPDMRVFCEKKRYDMLMADPNDEVTIIEFKSNHGMGEKLNTVADFFNKASLDINKLKKAGVSTPIPLPTASLKKYVISIWVEVTGPNTARPGIIDGIMENNFRPNQQRVTIIKNQLQDMKENPEGFNLKSVTYDTINPPNSNLSVLWSIMEVN